MGQHPSALGHRAATGPWMMALTAILSMASAGCDAASSTSVSSSSSALASPPVPQLPPALEPIAPIGGRRGPQVSREVLSRYRLELCFFGAVGLEVAREAYWDSLGPNEPSALNIPQFGRYAEYERRRGKRGAPSLAEKLGRLPFDGAVRSCSSAKSPPPGDAALSEALGRFDERVSLINRTLSEASRYYAREEYRRDRLRRGRELHLELSDILAGLDDAQQSFRPHFVAWLRGRVALAAPGDAGPSDKEQTAIDSARWLALALLALPRDSEAERRALGAAEGAVVRAAAAARPAAEMERVTASLEVLLGTARELVAVEGKLSPSQRYRVASDMIAVLQALHRAKVRALGGDDDPLGRLPRASPSLMRPPVQPRTR